MSGTIILGLNLVVIGALLHALVNINLLDDREFEIFMLIFQSAGLTETEVDGGSLWYFQLIMHFRNQIVEARILATRLFGDEF